MENFTQSLNLYDKYYENTYELNEVGDIILCDCVVSEWFHQTSIFRIFCENIIKTILTLQPKRPPQPENSQLQPQNRPPQLPNNQHQISTTINTCFACHVC